jgi:hypothetical protein
MEQSDTAIAPAAEPRNEDSAKEFSPNETTVAQVVRKRKIRYELGTVIKLIIR